MSSDGRPALQHGARVFTTGAMLNAAVIGETLRRHLSSVAYLIFLMLIGLVGLFASGFALPGSMWPSLVGLLAIITGSAIIGPEFSTGTLQLIVSKPIRRTVYLLSRFTGVFASVGLAAVVGLIAEIAGRLMHGEGPVPWERLSETFGGELAVALLVIAILTCLGSLTRAYYNAAIYLGTEAAMSVAQSILATLRMRQQGIGGVLARYPMIERGLATVDDVLFASFSGQLTPTWLLRIAVTAAVALVLACVAFERREVPYGSD